MDALGSLPLGVFSVDTYKCDENGFPDTTDDQEGCTSQLFMSACADSDYQWRAPSPRMQPPHHRTRDPGPVECRHLVPVDKFAETCGTWFVPPFPPPVPPSPAPPPAPSPPPCVDCSRRRKMLFSSLPCCAPPEGECVPGQHGPPCEGNEECLVYTDCLRCAGSGFCTDVPLMF